MTEATKAPRLKIIAAPTGTFPVEITVRQLDGTEGAIVFQCIARTQTAWAKERDALQAMHDASQKTEEAEHAPLAGLFGGLIAKDAAIVPIMAKGWDLDNEFDLPSLKDMEDIYPGAVHALLNAYSAKIHGARLGN